MIIEDYTLETLSRWMRTVHKVPLRLEIGSDEFGRVRVDVFKRDLTSMGDLHPIDHTFIGEL